MGSTNDILPNSVYKKKHNVIAVNQTQIDEMTIICNWIEEELVEPIMATSAPEKELFDVPLPRKHD